MLKTRRLSFASGAFLLVLVAAGCVNPFASSAGPAEKRERFEELFPEAPRVTSVELEPNLGDLTPWGQDTDPAVEDLAVVAIYSPPEIEDGVMVCVTERNVDRCGAPIGGARVKLDSVEDYDVYEFFSDADDFTPTPELASVTWVVL